MDSVAIDTPEDLADLNEIERPLSEQIINYYDEATADYEHWSKNFNMHFGYYNPWKNPFNRESMLNQLNLEVAARLQLEPEKQQRLIDLGCGVGAVARFMARHYPKTTIEGVTITPSQIEKGIALTVRENLQSQVNFINADYAALPFETGCVDGVWAIESACYARGADKKELVKEMARVLKKNGRFVISDGFIKQPEKNFDWLTNKCYQAICKNWVLPEMAVLDDFVAALKAHGLTEVVVEDVSQHIAPSVAHVPFAVMTFILKKLLAREKLKQQSINNLKASLMPVMLGLNRSKFSYYFISGRRT